MGRSSLERTGETPPVTKKGHNTEALGPSDLSDTGSDITGAPGLDDDDALPLAHRTTSDSDRVVKRKRRTAGPDIGDQNLDSDTDSGGTGERAAAGRDAETPNDEHLNVIDARTGDSDDFSAEDLEEELVEEDRESGDEAAPDLFGVDVASAANAKKRKASPYRSKPNGESQPKARRSRTGLRRRGK
jgi:hypothetical protein